MSHGTIDDDVGYAACGFSSFSRGLIEAAVTVMLVFDDEPADV